MPLLVFAAVVPAGEIEQVRLVVEDASLTTQGATGNVTQATAVPSGGNTGIKLVVRDSPLLPDGGSVAVLGTLVLGDQLVTTSARQLLFKPTVPAETLDRPTIHDHLGEDEVLLAVATRDFPLTGIRLERAKVFNQSTFLFRNLELDAATGEVRDFTDARAEHETVWREDRGALHHALARFLESKPPDAVVDVFVWAVTPPRQPLLVELEDPLEWDAAHTDYVQQARELNRQAVVALKSELLDLGVGVDIRGVELHPARISVRARRDLVEQEIAFLPGAQLITLRDDRPAFAGVRAARDLVQEPLSAVHQAGFGRNLRIAIVEPQACIHDEDDDFRFVTFEASAGLNDRCTALGRPVSAHATAVAAGAGSVRGNEPGLDRIGLFAGRMFESELGQITADVIDRNPHFINLSYLTAPDERAIIDSTVFLDRIFIANGAGNSDVAAGNFVARCEGFNAICVGGYRHQDTIGIDPDTGVSNFGDDTIADDPGKYSLWENNPDTGREEPDLVGPWSQSLPDGTGQTSSWSGTSHATPSVLGTGALTVAAFQGLLGNPTLLRAALIASATHSVDDFEDDQSAIASVADGIDDKSGSGAPRGDRLVPILLGGRRFSGYLDRVTDFDGDGVLREVLSVRVQTGDIVRVALVWDQCTESTVSMADALLVDLDLVVIGPGSEPEQVKANSSLVDNYEVIHFLATDDGEYRIQIQATRWDVCEDGTQRTFVAAAWDHYPIVP